MTMDAATDVNRCGLPVCGHVPEPVCIRRYANAWNVKEVSSPRIVCSTSASCLDARVLALRRPPRVTPSRPPPPSAFLLMPPHNSHHPSVQDEQNQVSTDPPSLPPPPTTICQRLSSRAPMLSLPPNQKCLARASPILNSDDDCGTRPIIHESQPSSRYVKPDFAWYCRYTPTGLPTARCAARIDRASS